MSSWRGPPARKGEGEKLRGKGQTDKPAKWRTMG
eukprot:CAMPEP_0202040322 /NCGR_PEP_ID=MMETSP0962-20130828/20231_1 /ASSEMBLY_ACC=CAM_ASM_000488 /TAXON_ID=4773 /ORGANISM="Schizochytrium aggregatum, Strain ATCC28209" /LENGTH=33 /DNA_ID= /DNA_START= /DNA_END= /DNA_ORIENTATION=